MPALQQKYQNWFSAAMILLVAFAVLLSCAPSKNMLENGTAGWITQTVPPAFWEAHLPVDHSPNNENALELTVFFTNPYSAQAQLRQGGLDTLLIQAIDRAKFSLRMAMYNLSLENVADTLIRARQRGLQVRVVMESDAMDGKQPRRLMDNGISIVGDQLESLMHNKYWMIDEAEVWTGSLNLTYTGTYDDHNNVLMLRNSYVVQNYLTDFEEMFTGKFGDAKRRNTPHPFIQTDDTKIETYFSPEDKPLSRLVTLVGGAQKRVLFLAYSFTSDALAEVMIERAEAGVEVRGVMESQQMDSNQGTEYERLRQAGLDVRLDGLEGQMHHKVILVDGRMVVMGSYNFTNSAERYNEENLLIIHNEALAKIYEDEFERIYARAIP